MSALDFLFEGRPPPSTTTYGTTSTDMPRWLSDYTQGLISRANAIAGEAYQPYEGPRLAGLNEDHQAAFDLTRGATGMYTPWINSAQQTAQGAIGAAMPFINQAGQTYTGDNVSKYMNPYIENVIDRAGTLTQRQLNEKLMPSVQAAFGAAGSGPRSNVMRRTVDQGVRDLTEGLHQQSLGALASGYESGANIFGADANRMGVLGNIVGDLHLDTGQTGALLAGQAQDMTLKDAAARASIGDAIQGDTQASLDLAYGDFQNQRNYPRSQADWLSSIIRGMPYNETTTRNETGPANVYQPSGAAQLGSLVTTGMGIWDIIKDMRGRSGGANPSGGFIPDLGGLIEEGMGKARGGRIGYRRAGRVGYRKGGRAMRGALCYA